MRIMLILAALAAVPPACAKPCNDVVGCMIRAEMCTTSQPEKCHVERLPQEEGVGLCTMTMMAAATVWITGDDAAGKAAHPGFRFKAVSCVTPDDFDL